MAESKMDQLFTDLKKAREELELQMHLGKAEARDEWEKMEEKWEQMRSRMEVVGDAAEDKADDIADDIKETLEGVGEELKKGYEKIKGLL